MSVRSPLIAGLAVLGLAACASAPRETPPPPRASAPAGEPGQFDQAFTQPFHDLSLMRVDPAPLLAAARVAPYAAPVPAECATLAQKIADLDAVLGVDIDNPDSLKSNDNLAAALVSGAIRDVVGLPFRGVIRRLSGAETRDRDVRASVLAGMVRRGFLKGQAAARGCPPVAPADR